MNKFLIGLLGSVAALAACEPNVPVDDAVIVHTDTNKVSVVSTAPESGTNYDKDRDGKLDCPINPSGRGMDCTLGEFVDSVYEKCLVDHKIRDIANPTEGADLICQAEAEYQLKQSVMR